MSENGSEGNQIPEDDKLPKKTISRRALITGAAAVGAAAVAAGPLHGVEKVGNYFKKLNDDATIELKRREEDKIQHEIDRTVSLQDLIQNPQEIYDKFEENPILTTGYIELDGEPTKEYELVSYGNPLIKGGTSPGRSEVVTARYRFYNHEGDDEYIEAEKVDKGEITPHLQVAHTFNANYVEYNGEVTVSGVLKKQENGEEPATYQLEIDSVIPQSPESTDNS